jgi:hypothetical protein
VQTLRVRLDWLEWWFLWILVTGISWCVGLILALIVAKGVSLVLPQLASFVIGGIVTSALIGLVQWALLRPGARSIGLWTLATITGWMGGLLVITLCVRVTDLAFAHVIGAALGGLVFGLAQWLAMRPKTDARAVWLLGTSAGWTLAIGLGISMGSNSLPKIVPGEVVGLAAAGAMGWMVVVLVATVVLVCSFPRSERRETTAYIRWWW